MDTKQLDDLTNNVVEGVIKQVPEVVDTVVDEKMKGVKETVESNANSVKELTESVADMAQSIKNVGSKNSEKSLEDAKTYMGTFLKALKKSKNQEVATKAALETGIKANEMNEGTDADGGFLVPDEFYKAVFHRVSKAGVARQLCTVIPMATDTLDMNKVAGGVTVGWVAENTAYQSSKPGFLRPRLIAKKVGAIVPATLELIADNMSNETIWDIAIKSATNAIMYFEDTQILTGDGVGSNVLGVLNHPNVNSVVTPTNAFTSLTYENLIDMIYGIQEKDITSEGSMKFVGHRSMLGQIKKLTDDNNRPIVEYVGNGQNQSTLVLGYEFITTPVAPGIADSAADTEFLIFGDMSSFILGDRQTLTMDYGHRAGDWEKDVQSLKVRERFDAELIYPESLSVLKTAA